MASPKHLYSTITKGYPTKHLYAAIAKGNPTKHSQPPQATISNSTTTENGSLVASKGPDSQATGNRHGPHVAFISGHIDITKAQFSGNYSTALDAAIQREDIFIVSNSRGADTLALAYLRSHNVECSRITIFLHRSRANRKPGRVGRPDQIDIVPELEDKYKKEGYNIRVITGSHTERDAAMTDASDYDILWVRGDTETAALYGSKYRPGRVSGTQKNKERRIEKEMKVAGQTVA